MTETTERTPSETEPGRGRFGSLGSILYLLALTWVAAIASFPLNDNSFFTHLATGRIVLDQGRIPTADPYSFTAAGESWTVQSWLASVIYAGAEQLGADLGLRLVVLALFIAALTVLWRLVAPAESVLVRIAILTMALVVAIDLWGERPYMFGVIGLGIVWLALERDVPPWVLVPVMWIWVNTHGSFPLATVLVLCWIAGNAIDVRGGTAVSRDQAPGRVLGYVVAGTVLGGLNPLGPKILWFPLTAVSRSDVFAEVIEWRPPTYQLLSERAFLVLLAATLLLLLRKQSWRLGIPAVAFGLAAVYAQRNVVMATVVLVAVTARCAPSLGTLRSGDRPPLGGAVAGVAAALAGIAILVAVTTPAPGFGGYPVRALAWTESARVPGQRTATEMYTGNLLGLLDGPQEAVFIDDRVDMFPTAVFEDYLVLVRGGPAWAAVLDEYDIDAVVWDRAGPLGALLAVSPDWAVRYSDAAWVVACRRAVCAPLEGSDPGDAGAGA